MPKPTLEQIVEYMGYSEKRYLAELGEWKKRFDLNPADAFRWAENACEAAARYEQVVMMRKFLSGEVNPDFAGDRLEAAIEEATRQVKRDARDRCWNSTSMMANVMTENRRTAAANMLGFLQGDNFCNP